MSLPLNDKMSKQQLHVNKADVKLEITSKAIYFANSQQ